MYHEIQKLSRLGFSKAKIAGYVVMDPRTVSRYLSMSEEEFFKYLDRQHARTKVLDAYEGFVKEKLKLYPDTSTAQIFDWLKESHADLPDVSTRTVFNFVMHVRQKHNIPFESTGRTYFPVEELPYGSQAQVDFGQYNMRATNNKRVKVYFFAMVLSRSRYKYVWFSEVPFTARSVCQAHENAFAFYGGMPKTIVYDQDRIMVVDENIGNIILTEAFRKYTSSRGFHMHFCRKADPESKGKVENVVQYIKKNFLYNRAFYDMSALNSEALAWLSRTANHLEHNFTKKSPESEFTIERHHLTPYTPISLETDPPKRYSVRKNNVVAYRSNFYSLPEGTYQEGTLSVNIKPNDTKIDIYTLSGQLLCSHTISMETGKNIINSNHKRDRSKTIDQMMERAAGLFTDINLAANYLHKVRNTYPRYCRDHFQHIIKTLENENNVFVANKTLIFCIDNQLYNAHDFEQVLHVLTAETQDKQPISIRLLGADEALSVKASVEPKKCDIDTYEDIINPNKQEV